MFKKFIVYLCIWCLCSTSIISTLTFANIDDQLVDDTVEVLLRLHNGEKEDIYPIELSKKDFIDFWEGVDEFQESLNGETTLSELVDIIEKILLDLQTFQDTYMTKEGVSKDYKNHFSFLSNVKLENKIPLLLL